MKTFKNEKKGERQKAAGSRDAFLVSFIFGGLCFLQWAARRLHRCGSAFCSPPSPLPRITLHPHFLP